MFQPGNEGIHKNLLLTAVGICWISYLHTHGIVALSECIIKNQTGRTNCSFTERNEIKSLLFMVLDNVTDGCPTNINVPKCNGIISTTQEGADRHPAFLCSGLKHQCDIPFGTPPSKKIPVPRCDLQGMANVMQMNYSCIAESRFINLCGDVRTDSSSAVHLAYFQSPLDDNKRDCKCVIKGPGYRLTAVYVSVPQIQKDCPSSTLLIQGENTNVNYNISTSRGITLVNEILLPADEMIQLDYHHDCDSANLISVWFKLEPTSPETNSKINILCGENASRRPSSQTSSHTESLETTETLTIEHGASTETLTNSSNGASTETLTNSSNGASTETLTNSSNGASTETSTNSSNGASTETSTNSSNGASTETSTNSSNAGIVITTQRSRVSTNYSSIIPGTGVSISSSSSTDETLSTLDDQMSTLLLETTTTNTLKLVDQKAAVIAGSVIGGVLFLIIIIVCIAIVYRKYRRKRNLKPNSTYLSDNEGFSRNLHESFGNSGYQNQGTVIYNEPGVHGMSNNSAAFAVTDSNSIGYELVEPGALYTTNNQNLNGNYLDNVNRRLDTTFRTKAPVYSQVNKSQKGVRNNGRLHLYDHVGADEVEYDHIRSEQTVERAQDESDADMMDSTYHQLYDHHSNHGNHDPTDTEQGLANRDYKLANLAGEQNPEYLSAETGPSQSSYDDSLSSHVYHVLEKPPQSIANIVESVSTFPEDMEFEENFMYQSADQVIPPTIKSSNFPEDMEFEENYMYQSADQVIPPTVTGHTKKSSNDRESVL